jgi:RNA polymerase sigma-70 factor, ECF subfamily
METGMQLSTLESKKREGVLVQMIHSMETTTVPVQLTTAYARWDEGDLVARAKTHSEAAFEQLVDQYKRRAFRLAWKITRHQEDAEDVVQTAFAKAFQSLPDFRGDSRFYTWLVRITINEALMKIRRRHSNEVSIDESREADDNSTPIEIKDQAPNPEQRYSQYEVQRILAATINDLDPPYRAVLQLRDVEGFSTKQTAQALALTSAAVKTRLQRARMKLRGSLTNYFRPTRASSNQGRCAERYSETVSSSTARSSRENRYRTGLEVPAISFNSQGSGE